MFKKIKDFFKRIFVFKPVITYDKEKTDDKLNEKRLNVNKKPERIYPNFFLELAVTMMKVMVVLVLAVGAVGIGVAVGVAKAYYEAAPDLSTTMLNNFSETSFIYDKDGNLVTEYYGFENRVYVSLDEVPDNLKNAIIDIEDERFYSHNGIDLKRIFAVIVSNFTNGTNQGASTITQQVIKNTVLSSEQTYRRKIQEMFLAMELEKTYSKDEILESYMNIIHLGSSNYGVKAAAENYFGKDLSELTLRECAMIAGSIKNPYLYNIRRNLTSVEDGGRYKPEYTFDRANTVLYKMYENGDITEAQYNEAKFDTSSQEAIDAEVATITLAETGSTSNDYPMKYYLEYLINEVKTDLMAENGWEGSEGEKLAENMLYTNGLKIYSNLDTELQQEAEQIVYDYTMVPAFKYDSSYVSSDGTSQPQAAAILLEQGTGYLRAIVGGKQEPEIMKGLNRAYQSKLPLGSCVKPLAVYGPFIEAGYPGGLIIDNIPAAISGWNTEKGYPDNYGGGSYSGPTAARTGIKNSWNVIAARIVCERVGVETSYNTMLSLGFDPDTVSGTPSGLSLGSDGNYLIDTVTAYSTIVNHGVYQESTSYTTVTDKYDNVILDSNTNRESHQVFKDSTCYILIDWMKEVVHGGTCSVYLDNNMQVAGKTGTNSDFRGVAFAGFTPYYTCALWIGSDEYAAFRSGVSSGPYTAPLFTQLMNAANEGLEVKDFYDEVPEGVTTATVCGVSGKLATDMCRADQSHPVVSDYFPTDGIPGEVCDYHTSAELCGISGTLPGEYCPDSCVISSSGLALPEDSPYWLLSDETRSNYLTGIIGVLQSDGTVLQVGTSETCPLHTAEWAAGEELREAWKSDCNTKINQIKRTMSMDPYASKLTLAEVSLINTYIDDVLAALSEGEYTPTMLEEYMDELPVFDSTKTSAALTRLEIRAKEIFARIDEVVAKATPTPAPTPVPKSTPEPSTEEDD